LLQSFAAPCPGSASPLPCGFPSDQEVQITIDFVQTDFDPSSGAPTRTRPDLDLSTVKVCTAPGTACTLAVIALPTAPGGAPTFLLEQGKDLSRPENQTLLPGNTPAERAANGAALEQIRQLYVSGPFPVVDTVFPRTEIGTMTTFQVQPTGDARPVIDASSGTVPLPSNFLLDGSTLPDDPFAPATNARVSNQPAAFGPLAPGIATLDGFSTTALTLIPLSGVAVTATATGADATIPTTSKIGRASCRERV